MTTDSHEANDLQTSHRLVMSRMRDHWHAWLLASADLQGLHFLHLVTRTLRNLSPQLQKTAPRDNIIEDCQDLPAAAGTPRSLFLGGLASDASATSDKLWTMDWLRLQVLVRNTPF